MVDCVYNPNTQEVHEFKIILDCIPRQTRRSAKYYYVSNFGHVAKAAS